jgi:peptide deformylase
MPSREIIRYPDTRLKTLCDSAVDFEYAKSVVQDLLDTMDSCPPRTVGIAAPQIGELTRIVVVDASRNPKFEAATNGLLCLVNPMIVHRSGEQRFREGCLSLPDYTANIRRSASVVVEAFTIEQTRIVVRASGFEAVILQHEIDHLDGVLFLDRVVDMKNDLFARKRK